MAANIIKFSRNNILVKLCFTVFVSLAIIGLKIFIPSLGYRVPFLLVLFAVILSASFGGFWQGILSTVITGFLANYFFYNYPYSFNFTTPAVQLATISFFLEGVVSSWLMEVQRINIRKTRQQAAIIESSNDAIISKTLSDKITSWNAGAELMYGYTADEVIGKSINIIIPEKARNEERIVLQKIKHKEIIQHRQSVRKTKNGKIIWVSITSSPLLDENGNVFGLSTIARDITKSKEFENKLFEQAELLRLSHDAIIVQNHGKHHENIINFWNKGAAEMYGYSEKEALGKITAELLKTEFSVPVTEIHKIIEKRKFWEGELVHTRKDGKKIIVDSRWAFVKRRGRKLQVLEINRDITYRKELENRKDEFISIASHELKTPLTSMKTFVQILDKRLRQKGDKTDNYLLENIMKQVNRLTNLISDLLNANRITKGKLEINKSWFDLDKLIKKVVIDYQYSTDSHQIIQEGEIKKKIYADENRIEQVLTNLITNAIKYSPNAEKIVIRVTDNKTNVIVHVRDFGLGIVADEQKKIFEKFYRSTQDRSNNISGFGLGLYISMEIIKQHGGKIWVESVKGKGSTFSFSLPLSKKTA